MEVVVSRMGYSRGPQHQEDVRGWWSDGPDATRPGCTGLLCLTHHLPGQSLRVFLPLAAFEQGLRGSVDSFSLHRLDVAELPQGLKV